MYTDIRKLASSGLISQVAIVLIVALLLWFTGLPFMHQAQAARVTDFSDTLYRATPSALSSSTIAFTLQSNIVPGQSGQTLRLLLDPAGTLPSGASAFSQTFASTTATSSLIYLSAGGTDYNIVDSCTAGNEVTVVGNYNTGSDEGLTFTFCTGGAAIATSTVVTIGVGPVWTNPSTEQSYVIRLAGTAGVTGDTRVAIIQDVTVTASVDTSFTFTVTGTATSTTVNGTTTTFTTTNTAIPFNTLPLTGPVTGAQRLNVSTNASNGFVVTVYETQPLTNTGGDLIYLFNQGASTSVPTQWLAPSSTINEYNTYGHFGVTSSDDLNSSEFSGNKYVGNIQNPDSPRQIFEHNGPADGVTTNIGSTTIGYTIQIGPLQAAGDYTNTLRYVATPTF